MNIYIIEGSNAGPVNGRLAKAELVLAANSLNLNIVDSEIGRASCRERV